MFGFQYCLNTQFALCIVSRYHLILDRIYVTFQRGRLEVFMVIVYQIPVSLPGLFMPCYSSALERAEFGRQRFQYTWLNSNFFRSL